MAEFKIAAAQVGSKRGDIAGNLRTHAEAISAAAEHAVNVLVFPELSLTGYEPDLATALAITAADERLAPLAELARNHQMAIIAGAPLKNAGTKPNVGAILVDAEGKRSAYAKMHLGTSERPYFTPGATPLAFNAGGEKIGVAICADSSQPSHVHAYADGGCTVYAAGVFLNDEWYPSDAPRLAGYASQFRMLVVMANPAASLGTYTSVGKSAIWAPGGAVVAGAPGAETALVIATRTRDGWRGEMVRLGGEFVA